MPNIELKDISGKTTTYNDVNFVQFNTDQGERATYISDWIVQPQVQVDWNAVQEEGAPPNPAVILNKPDIPNAVDLLPEIEPEQDEGKILGVVNGEWQKTDMPEVPNVPIPDWMAEEGQPGYINNKPTIPNPQVQTDWNAVAPSMAAILNKPTDLVNEQYVKERVKEIPQPNWEEFDETSKAFIKNKPFSRPVGLIPDDTYTAIKDSEQGHYVINLSNLNFTVEQNVEYVVIFNGVSYELSCIGFEGAYGQLYQNEVGIGNASLVWLFSNQFVPNILLDLPFFIQDNYVYTKTSGEFQIYLCKKSDIKHLNKVFIPDELRVNPDWTQTEEGHLGYILNKPSDKDFQGNWEQTDYTKMDYIQNKPFGKFPYLVPSGNYKIEPSVLSNDTYPLINVKPLHSLVKGDRYSIFLTGYSYTNSLVQEFDVKDKTGVSHKILGIGNPYYCKNNAGTGDPHVTSCSSQYQDVKYFISENAVYIAKGSRDTDDTTYYFCAHLRDKLLKIDKKYLPVDVLAQANWTQEDSTAADYIKNKPNIPEAQIQADWTQTDTNAADYIKNKPEVLNQIQADYETRDSHSLSYIKNKIVGYYPDYISGTYVTYEPHSLSGYYYTEFTPGEDHYSNTEYWVTCCNQGKYLKSGYYYDENSRSVSGLGNPSLAIYEDQPFVPREPVNETLNFFINFETNIITTKTIQKESSYVAAYRSNNIIQLPKKFLPGQLLPSISSGLVAPYVGVENGEWTSKELPQSNWEETELWNPSAIINKPFGPKLDYMQATMLGLEESSVDSSYYQCIGLYHALKELTYSKTVRLVWEEREEIVTGKKGSNYGVHTRLDEEAFDMTNIIVYGNVSLLKNHAFIASISNPSDSGEDYCFCLLPVFTKEILTADGDGLLIVITKDGVGPNVFIKRVEAEYTKIDKKYLPDDLTIPTDKSLSLSEYPADAAVVGKKFQEVNKHVKLGAEYAGQLVYVGEDGYPSVLKLGRGLTIKNGVLMVVESSSETTSELDVGILDTMILPDE